MWLSRDVERAALSCTVWPLEDVKGWSIFRKLHKLQAWKYLKFCCSVPDDPIWLKLCTVIKQTFLYKMTQKTPQISLPIPQNNNHQACYIYATIQRNIHVSWGLFRTKCQKKTNCALVTSEFLEKEGALVAKVPQTLKLPLLFKLLYQLIVTFQLV